MLQTELQQIIDDPLRAAAEIVERWKCTALVKGVPTVVQGASGRAYINGSGDVSLATGGTGDVLTGVIASLIAQGYSPEHAAVFGAYIHGRAGRSPEPKGAGTVRPHPMLRWGSGARCASLREDDECLAGTHRYRPTWVEVDVTNIAENTRALASLGREKGLGLIAVVKADGYGHGALATAKAALSQGAEMLAVALPEEGATLRQGGITAPILVMGAYVPGTLEAYQRFSLMATVTDFDQLRSIVSESGGGPRRIAA